MWYDISSYMIHSGGATGKKITSLESFVIHDVAMDISSDVVLDEVLSVERRDHGIIVKWEHENRVRSIVPVINNGGIFQGFIESRSEESVFINQSQDAILSALQSPYRS